MNFENANYQTYSEIEIQGRKAFFCKSRVNARTVPYGLSHCELESFDKEGVEGKRLVERANGQFLGTVITQKPFQEIDEGGFVDLGDYEVGFQPGCTKPLMTLAKENGLSIEIRNSDYCVDFKEMQFREEFVGQESFGLHLSHDGLHLTQHDGPDILDKVLETDDLVFFEGDIFHYTLAFDKDDQGNIADCISEGWWADNLYMEELRKIYCREVEGNIVWMDEDKRWGLPSFAYEIEWDIAYKDAQKLTYQRTRAFGHQCLFTGESVDPRSVPKPLSCYEIGRGWGESEGKYILTNVIEADFLGTLITEKPLDVVGVNRFYFNKDEIVQEEGAITLKNFVHELGTKQKTPKSYER